VSAIRPPPVLVLIVVNCCSAELIDEAGIAKKASRAGVVGGRTTPALPCWD